jgi:hypothetical protein
LGVKKSRRNRDTFTIYDRWMDVNADGQATNIVKQPGTTLTFGVEPFTWVQLYAAEGDYVIGFIAEDLDGNVSAYAGGGATGATPRPPLRRRKKSEKDGWENAIHPFATGR